MKLQIKFTVVKILQESLGGQFYLKRKETEVSRIMNTIPNRK